MPQGGQHGGQPLAQHLALVVGASRSLRRGRMRVEVRVGHGRVGGEERRVFCSAVVSAGAGRFFDPESAVFLTRAEANGCAGCSERSAASLLR